MKQMIILAIVFCLTGYFLGTWHSSTKAGDQSKTDTYTVKRGDLTVNLAETGILKAKNSQRIISEVKRSSKITYMVKEGVRVAQGEVLVKLDNNEIIREIKNIEQKIRAAEAKCETSRGEIEIQKIEGENTIAKAKLTCEEAQKDMEKYVQGEFPLTEREKSVKVEESSAKLERARQKFAQMPDLLKDGFVTADQMREKEIECKKALVEFDTAKSELELLIKYTKPLEIQKKQAAITKAISELNAEQKQLERKLQQKKLELDSNTLELENSKAELAKLNKELACTEIHSPTDGLVIYGDPDRWWGDRPEVGKEVWANTTIMTLPDLSEMQVAFRIHEVDIRSIRLGMPVTTTVEAAGDVSLAGSVTKVAELASTEDRWSGDPDVRYFNTEVTLDKKNPGLKPGTTAKVEIGIHQLKNVLYIPVESVHTIEETTYCYVMAPGWQTRAIQIGLSNDRFVEVKSGLSEAEKIAIGIPSVPISGVFQPK